MRSYDNLIDREIIDLMEDTDIQTTDNYMHSNQEIGSKVIETWNELEL